MIEMRHFEWVLARQDLGIVFNDPVMVCGDGPLSVKRKTELLERAGVETAEIGARHSILVIGRKDRDTDALDGPLEDRVGEALQCYSQEMAVMVLLSGLEPHSHSVEDVTELGAGHPGLERLSRFGFTWPHAVVNDGIEPEDEEEGPVGSWGNGPLSARGYSVKRGGPGARERRQILTDVLTKSLSDLDRKFDLSEWGRPKSSERLLKIATTIAHLHNLRARTWRRAAKKWREDLDWLKQNYYERGRMPSWPSAFIDAD